MENATLYCSSEKVFFNNLLVERPTLPRAGLSLKNARRLKVNILEVMGEQVLILLPHILEGDEQETAMIDIKYLY